VLCTSLLRLLHSAPRRLKKAEDLTGAEPRVRASRSGGAGANPQKRASAPRNTTWHIPCPRTHAKGNDLMPTILSQSFLPVPAERPVGPHV
jgi:hypothetical protein